MQDRQAVEVQDLPLVQVTSEAVFARAPMTFEGIVMQPGVSGYRSPTDERPWLELRLQDGCWIRVRPVDELLQFYQIVPFGVLAVRAGIKEEFLAVWAAFIRIARLATNALERAVEDGLPQATEPCVTGEDETGPYTSVLPVDYRRHGTRVLDSFSRQVALGSCSEVSVSGRFSR